MKRQGSKKSLFRTRARNAKTASSAKQGKGKQSSTTAKSSKASLTKSRNSEKKSSRQATGRRLVKIRKSIPRTASQFQAKPEKFKETWDRVLSVISNMRTEKVSLSQAAQEAGVSPRTVIRWGGSALSKNKHGKYAAKSKDTMLRMVVIPTPDGVREIAVKDSRLVSVLGEYWNALHRYLQTGDSSELDKFRGKNIKDADGKEISLSTDRSILSRLGSAGVLSFESLYARSA